MGRSQGQLVHHPSIPQQQPALGRLRKAVGREPVQGAGLRVGHAERARGRVGPGRGFAVVFQLPQRPEALSRGARLRPPHLGPCPDEHNPRRACLGSHVVADLQGCRGGSKGHRLRRLGCEGTGMAAAILGEDVSVSLSAACSAALAACSAAPAPSTLPLPPAPPCPPSPHIPLQPASNLHNAVGVRANGGEEVAGVQMQLLAGAGRQGLIGRRISSACVCSQHHRLPLPPYPSLPPSASLHLSPPSLSPPFPLDLAPPLPSQLGP